MSARTRLRNCSRNGIVPVGLPADIVQQIAEEVDATKGTGLVTVDVEAKTVTTPSCETFDFEAPEALRQMLLFGQARSNWRFRSARRSHPAPLRVAGIGRDGC